jgi:hypothetical protein
VDADRAIAAYRNAIAEAFSRASRKIAAGEISTDYDCGQFLETELAASRSVSFRPINERLAAIKDLKVDEWKPRAVSLTREISTAFKVR